MTKREYFRVFGQCNDWLDSGILRFNISDKTLRIGNPKISDDENSLSDLYELEKAVKMAVPFFEVMFGAKCISFGNNGFGYGGTCVDIMFDRRIDK